MGLLCKVHRKKLQLKIPKARSQGSHLGLLTLSLLAPHIYASRLGCPHWHWCPCVTSFGPASIAQPRCGSTQCVTSVRAQLKETTEGTREPPVGTCMCCIPTTRLSRFTSTQKKGSEVSLPQPPLLAACTICHSMGTRHSNPLNGTG